MDDGPSKNNSKKVSTLPNYKFVKTLGRGSFGKVKLAVHIATGERVAIKIINRLKVKKRGLEEKVQRETKIMRILSHPNIIRQYEVIETADDIYVVMEYVDSGELFKYIANSGGLPEDEARRLFQQIISGVEYCHRNKIVHRDLKPENMLLDSENNIKIVDFGLSNFMEDGNLLMTNCGSPNYAAPEVISGKPYSGPEIDIWSSGVILYALLCGTLPFMDGNIPKLFQKIKSGVYTLPGHLSCDARDLVSKLLVVDPMMRISILEIRQHPWFNNHLPHHLTMPPLDTTEQVETINEEIIQKMINMGFDGNHIVQSLVNKIQNEATVTYHLILDKHRSDPCDYIHPNSTEIMEDPVNTPIPLEVVAVHVGHPFTALVNQFKASLRPNITINEINWTLDLEYKASLDNIMSAVISALENLKVLWNIGPIMECIWIPSFANNNVNMTQNDIFLENNSSMVMDVDERALLPPSMIKFELRLYEVCEEKYLLEIQRVDGPQFLFFNISVALLSELGVL